MNHQYSGSRVEKTEAQHDPNLLYVGEYDSYGYIQPQKTWYNNPLNQSSAGREGYHIHPTQFHTPNTGTAITTSRVKSESSRLLSSQVKNEEVVKGESRVNYVPYEKKVIEYENRTYVEKVPVKRKVVKYEQRSVIQTIPREVIRQDFYAVEKRIQYYKEVVPEKKIEMVPVQKKVKRYEYVPVEKQIVHYPQNVDLETAKGQSRVILRNQGVEVKADAEYRPINSALIYNYSSRPESKYTPIGYVDQGQARPFSNSPTFMNSPFLQQPQQAYYGQEPTYLRTQSAQKLERSRVFSPRQFGQARNSQQGESYIKELNNLGKGELKRPFELLQQSNAKNQGGNYPHLQKHAAHWQQRDFPESDYPLKSPEQLQSQGQGGDK